MRWTYWAESADQNKAPIAQAIEPYLVQAKTVLELGSGTGQHAVHLAGQHAHLSWQPSEHPKNLSALVDNMSQNTLPNIQTPIALDASATNWPSLKADMLFSANTLHIMSWGSVCQLFHHLGKLLEEQQVALFYGPFRFSDRAFAPSNVTFDQWLKGRDPLSGIRDIDALIDQGNANGLQLESAIEMPANNHILQWRRNDR
ncbi:MAG: DUF938 domain-containing protein [Granulosicoccaceae bacterium]